MQWAVYIFRQLWVSRNICSAHNLIWFVNVSPKKRKLSKMKNYFSDINHWQSVKFFAWYIFRRLLITSAAIICTQTQASTHTHTKHFIMASSNNCFLLQNYILSYLKFPLWRFNWSPLLFLTTFIMPARYTIIIDNSHYIPT